MNMNDDDGYPSQLTPLQKKDWIAAHVLHSNGIPACLVGPPASAFYGSDDLWIRILVIVNDPAFEDACKVLYANGYEEASMRDDEYAALQPSGPCPAGKEPMRWRRLVSRIGSGVILAPGSHWHFDVSEDTTIVIDGYPLPKFTTYLQALMSVLAYRRKMSIPPGYFVLQTLNVLVLRDKYPNAMKKLSPIDEFILDHYFSVRRPLSRLKVVELWEDLKRGVLTVEEAVSLVPVEQARARQVNGIG